MKDKLLKKTVAIGLSTLTAVCINTTGAMAEWKVNESNNTWSWIENDIQVTGWKNINNLWYYFNDDGIMHTGWLKDNNKWYKLSENGNMLTGWIQDNGKWYYASPSGELETGNLTIDGKLYNFLSDGTMVEEEKTADFSNNSVLANSTSIPDKDGIYNVKEDNQSNKQNNDAQLEESNISSNQSTENIEESSDANFEIRTVQPEQGDKHYYSDDNIFYKVKLSPPFKKSDGSPIKGNCTWYTWGRIWEITGEKPTQAGFIGNAYEWWEANKNSKKYEYGLEPRVGAIAVWKSSLPGSGGCGHVAVVEKIENGKVYISESMWHGGCFAYKEIYSTEYLYGYIYVDKPNF